MKKLIILILTFVMGFFTITCKDDVIPSYLLKIVLKFPTGFTLANAPEGAEVKVLNTLTGRESKATTDATGSINLTLIEGTYKITCSFTYKAGTDEYVFNAIKDNYLLVNDGQFDLALVLADNTGGFIFKEIYFAGSKTADAKTYYSDQFHEIYNNSNDTLYADGLCLGVLEQTSSNPNVWLKADGTTFMDELPLTFHVWMIPGTGKQHPVYPGKSIVIAMDGIDHKTDPNGNPLSPVNMGNADWETYVEAPGKDTDTPAVGNLIMMYTTSTSMVDWIHSVFGAAVVIFRLPTAWETYVANSANFMTKPGTTSTTKYFMINKSHVVDAVEIVRVEEDKRNKRLHTELDAGYTYLDGGTYCSKSVRRKAKLIVDGRVIYKDTNNSSQDFLHDVTPTPRVNPTTVEN